MSLAPLMNMMAQHRAVASVFALKFLAGLCSAAMPFMALCVAPICRQACFRPKVGVRLGEFEAAFGTDRANVWCNFLEIASVEIGAF